MATKPANEDAEPGELFISLRNLTDNIVTLEKGTRVAQVIIIPHLISSVAKARRIGGYGSTGIN
jgi:dUTPase